MALNLFDLALQQEGARRAAATAAQAALAAARTVAIAAETTRASAVEVLGAAFLAAAAGEAIHQSHIEKALQQEYEKTGRVSPH